MVADEADGAWYQIFMPDGAGIKNERGLVLSVEGDKDINGANVVVWKKSSSTTLSQSWIIQYVETEWITNGIIPDKPFQIISKLGAGRALTRAGEKVVIQDANKSNADQIFVFDSNTGSIQPKRNNKIALDIGEDGRNRYVRFGWTKDIWHQHFQLEGDYVVNERGLVFDVAGGKDQNNNSVLAWKKHNGTNQKWKINYV